MIFIILISVFIYFNRFEEKVFVCGTPDLISICGNTLNENQKEGRKLFKILCASCHKIDRRLVGPALGNIQMDSIPFYKYLTVKDSLEKKFHKTIFKQMSIKNTNELLLYLKINN